MFRIDTSAPATAAPCGSVTVPVKMPFCTCAFALSAAKAHISSTIATRDIQTPLKHFAASPKQFFAHFISHPREEFGRLSVGMIKALPSRTYTSDTHPVALLYLSLGRPLSISFLCLLPLSESKSYYPQWKGIHEGLKPVVKRNPP